MLVGPLRDRLQRTRPEPRGERRGLLSKLAGVYTGENSGASQTPCATSCFSSLRPPSPPTAPTGLAGAALAPADPSPQDQKVAARASLVITEAGQELQMVRLEQTKGKAEGKATPEAGSAEASPSASGEKGAVSGDQPGKEEPSGQEQPPKGQNPAAAIMAGLMRLPARFHIAV